MCSLSTGMKKKKSGSASSGSYRPRRQSSKGKRSCEAPHLALMDFKFVGVGKCTHHHFFCKNLKAADRLGLDHTRIRTKTLIIHRWFEFMFLTNVAIGTLHKMRVVTSPTGYVCTPWPAVQGIARRVRDWWLRWRVRILGFWPCAAHWKWAICKSGEVVCGIACSHFLLEGLENVIIYCFPEKWRRLRRVGGPLLFCVVQGVGQLTVLN